MRTKIKGYGYFKRRLAWLIVLIVFSVSIVGGLCGFFFVFPKVLQSFLENAGETRVSQANFLRLRSNEASVHAKGYINVKPPVVAATMNHVYQALNENDIHIADVEIPPMKNKINEVFSFEWDAKAFNVNKTFLTQWIIHLFHKGVMASKVLWKLKGKPAVRCLGLMINSMPLSTYFQFWPGILFGSFDQYSFQPLIGVKQIKQLVMTKSTQFDLSIWNPFPFSINVGRFRCKFYTEKMRWSKKDAKYPFLTRLFDVSIPWIHLQENTNIWPIHLLNAQMTSLGRLLLKNRKHSVKIFVKDIEFIFIDNWNENVESSKNMSGVHVDWIQTAFEKVDFNTTLPSKFIWKYIPPIPKLNWPWKIRNGTTTIE